MSDTMTLYAEGVEETVITIEPKPDPKERGKFQIKSENGEPFCCEFSLKEHSYNVVLPPGSYVIIGADNTEMFKEASSDDHVFFTLPSDKTTEFYVEQYFANMRDTSPYKVLALRYHERNRIVSAALYPRDLDKLPKPHFITPDGKEASVLLKGVNENPDPDAKVEYAHHPAEIEFIKSAIFRIVDKSVAPVDPNAPKEDWF